MMHTMPLVGESLDYQLASVSGVRLPSELLWQILLSRKLEKNIAAPTLDRPDILILSLDTSKALEKIVERYDIPRYWFEELMCEGGNINPIEFSPSDTSRKTRRRKTWGKMQRDFSIFRYRLQGKKVPEIYFLIQSEFNENLAHGNIKKIISDVGHRKLGLDEVVISF